MLMMASLILGIRKYFRFGLELDLEFRFVVSVEFEGLGRFRNANVENKWSAGSADRENR
jgi:hypothetical protein